MEWGQGLANLLLPIHLPQLLRSRKSAKPRAKPRAAGSRHLDGLPSPGPAGGGGSKGSPPPPTGALIEAFPAQAAFCAALIPPAARGRAGGGGGEGEGEGGSCWAGRIWGGEGPNLHHTHPRPRPGTSGMSRWALGEAPRRLRSLPPPIAWLHP